MAFCNCRIKNNCPFNGKCWTEGIVYCAEAESGDDNAMAYVGFTEDQFNKKRCYNHRSSFRIPKRNFCTSLAKHYCGFREIHYRSPAIEWSILRKLKNRRLDGISCRLWQVEKLAIANYKDVAEILNERTEVVTKCRHRRKLDLGIYEHGWVWMIGIFPYTPTPADYFL